VFATDATVGRALSIADLDGDNANDVALAVVGGVDIFTQSGGALDPTATFLATTSTPSQIAVAPVDGDPNNDIVAGGPDGIHVYYGPAWGAPDAVETTTPITHSLAVGDVKGNPSADIVATASDTVLVYMQAGAHNFTESSHVVTKARAIATGDVNDDGHVDAVATMRNTPGRLRTILNGDTLGALTSTSNSPDAVAIADVDQDGDNDVVVLHDDSGEVGVLSQEGGTLGDEDLFFFDDFHGAYGARALAVDDVDSDTYPDIVAATTYGVSILIQNAPHLPALSNTWIAGTSPAALATNVASGVTPVLTLDHIPTNVDDTTVQLFDASGGVVSQTPVWNLGGRTVTITPDVGLTDGAYTVRVDGLSDGSADEFGDYFLPFTVGPAPDRTAPSTALVSPPTGYRAIAAATLKFTSNDGAAAFECSLDNEKYHACTSPIHVEVARGAHSFRVFARDLAGNEDPTPAQTTWTFRPPPKGYWMVSRTGVVYHFGSVPGFGNAPTIIATDIEPSKSGYGYWVVDAFGRVFAFGDAVARGDASGLLVGETVTSLSRTASGNGYWLFTSRGRVLPFGDAHSYGDLRNRVLNGPIQDSVRTPSGHGYFMVAADGGVFAFGDAVYKGSTGGIHIPAPIRTLVADADGTGYWLVGTDGSVYAFAATNRGSMHGVPLNRPIAGMVGFGVGYLMSGPTAASSTSRTSRTSVRSAAIHRPARSFPSPSTADCRTRASVSCGRGVPRAGPGHDRAALRVSVVHPAGWIPRLAVAAHCPRAPRGNRGRGRECHGAFRLSAHDTPRRARAAGGRSPARRLHRPLHRRARPAERTRPRDPAGRRGIDRVVLRVHAAVACSTRRDEANRARCGARSRNNTRKNTNRPPVRAVHCTMMLLLSAPAVNPWIVAVRNNAKLDRCTACQTRRGMRRIAHDVTWIATRK
jgi:hypothetical protein